MANKIFITLDILDKGSPKVKKFGNEASKSLDRVKASARAGATQAGKMERAWGSAAKKMQLHWKAYSVAAVAAAGMMAKKSISAFMEQEKAEMKLAVAMRNQGDFTKANFAVMKDYAAQLQKVTTYGDEVTLATMANLKTYGMSTEELKKATVATMDLASAKGIDLKAASELVGKAFVGETGSLSKYGIVLEKGIPKTEKFAAVLGLIGDSFGGSAQAEIETYSGQLKQMSNWWGDIAEKVGFGLLKALEAVQFAVGMVATGFYTVMEGLVSSLAKFLRYAEKIPIVGKKFKGMADTMEDIAGGLGLAKDNAMEFTAKNYKMMTSFNRVEDAIGKMGDATGDAGDRTKKLTAEQKKAAATAEKLLMDFSGKYQKLTLGDYNYAVKKIKEQGKIYKKAGADHLKVEKWVSAEIGKVTDTATASIAADVEKAWALEVKASEATAKAYIKSAEAKAKATEDYARESTRIYERLVDDANKNSLSEYKYKEGLLGKQYDEYKEHLVSLGKENAKYADGVKLLDTWLDNEKQKLWEICRASFLTISSTS
ncbi:MAG: hypothetical protein JRD89_20335 [Deltaproteobacteria bacterium]|nr:hypothetical protein [Deltaproteobacteria bacterium]